MSELTDLQEIYDLMFQETDTSTESFLEGLANEGQTLEFLELIRDRPSADQAFFISALVKIRPECKNRLVELAGELDENVQVFANVGLLYTDRNPSAIEFFKQKVYDRLNNDALNEGDWPIHFLLDHLMERDVPGRIEAIKAIEKYGISLQNVNAEQLRYITQAALHADS